MAPIITKGGGHEPLSSTRKPLRLQSSREESLGSDRQPLSNKYEILETAKVGSEVGIIASAEEFDQRFAMVIIVSLISKQRVIIRAHL